MNLLVTWAISALAVWLTALLVPGIRVRGVAGAIISAAVFGALHWALAWFLFVAIGIGTLFIGFLLAFVTRWIVDAIILKLTASLTTRLEVKGFFAALLGALVLSVLTTAGEYLWQTPRVQDAVHGPPAEVRL